MFSSVSFIAEESLFTKSIVNYYNRLRFQYNNLFSFVKTLLIDYLDCTCPHNIWEKLQVIAENGESSVLLSNTNIRVRIDIKNHSSKIPKATANKFVEDTNNNPDFDEHWLIGGNGLTKGAQEVFDESQKKGIHRYMNQEDWNNVGMYYEKK